MLIQHTLITADLGGTEHLVHVELTCFFFLLFAEM